MTFVFSRSFVYYFQAIEGYRETERGKWSDQNEAVLSRVRQVAFAPSTELLPYVHILDLAAAGHIKPHVDAVRVSFFYSIVHSLSDYQSRGISSCTPKH